MTYPSDIYEQRPLENLPGLEYDPLNKKTLFAEDIEAIGSEVTGIENTLGVGLSNIETMINSAIVQSWDIRFPVGTIYGNGQSMTNPGEFMGFGAWEPYAEGRVVAGIAADGTFDTIGKTLGEEDHILSQSEMPDYNLTGNTNTTGSHNHINYSNLTRFSGGTSEVGLASGSRKYLSAATNSNAGSHSHTVTINSGGDGIAHNNIQPTIVAAMWIRVS